MYDIPVTHPLINHFPIAFLLLAGGTVLVWLLTGRPFWRQSTLLLTALGAAATVAAIVTGNTMKEFSGGRAIVKQLVERHKFLAYGSLITASIALLTLLGVRWWAHRSHNNQFVDSFKVRLVVSVLLVIAAILVGLTGHLGGTMTWGELSLK